MAAESLSSHNISIQGRKDEEITPVRSAFLCVSSQNHPSQTDIHLSLSGKNVLRGTPSCEGDYIQANVLPTSLLGGSKEKKNC